MEHETNHPEAGSEDARLEGAATPPPTEEGIVWSPEAWDRVKNAPAFVRPGIMKLMVRRAKERGLTVITSDFLTEMRNSSMMKVSRRLHRYGFQALAPETFEVAKAKMQRRPRTVAVIEAIQGHLAARQRKNQGIIRLFQQYFASMTQGVRAKRPEAPKAGDRKDLEENTPRRS